MVSVHLCFKVGLKSERHLEILIMWRADFTFKLKSVVHVSDRQSDEFIQFKLSGHFLLRDSQGWCPSFSEGKTVIWMEKSQSLWFFFTFHLLYAVTFSAEHHCHESEWPQLCQSLTNNFKWTAVDLILGIVFFKANFQPERGSVAWSMR